MRQTIINQDRFPPALQTSKPPLVHTSTPPQTRNNTMSVSGYEISLRKVPSCEIFPLQSAQFGRSEGEAPPLAGSALSEGGECRPGDDEG